MISNVYIYFLLDTSDKIFTPIEERGSRFSNIYNLKMD